MKGNVRIIILLELILLVAAMGILVFLCGQDIGITMINLWDPFSCIFILLITLPGLLIMGEGKNFLKAFLVGEKKYSLLELKDINGAVAVCQKLVLYGGIVGIIVQLIILLGMLTEPALVGPNTAVALIIVLYTAVLEFLLIPLKLNAEKALNKEMDMDVEE